MDSVPNVLKRTKLQNICLMLLYGEEYDHIQRPQATQQHLDALTCQILDGLEKIKNIDQFSAANDLFYDYSETLENVYFETGLKCGIALMAEVFASWLKTDRK